MKNQRRERRKNVFHKIFFKKLFLYFRTIFLTELFHPIPYHPPIPDKTYNKKLPHENKIKNI
jgi:hypothetical protein